MTVYATVVIAALSGSGASVYNSNRVFNSCAYLTLADQRTACEARAAEPSQDKGFSLDAYAAAKSCIDQSDQFMQQIDHTQDRYAISTHT